MKPRFSLYLVFILGFAALLEPSTANSQTSGYKSYATTDGQSPSKRKSDGVTCSLKTNRSTPLSDREASYRVCVHDHKGPEYDERMEMDIKEQKNYENALVEADKKNIPIDQRGMWIRARVEASEKK